MFLLLLRVRDNWRRIIGEEVSELYIAVAFDALNVHLRSERGRGRPNPGEVLSTIKL